MARYLLDTTALIDHLRGRPEVVGLLTQLARQGHELGVCSINVAELYSGLAEQELPKADRLVDNLAYYELTREAAKVAGGYRSTFSRKGITLTTCDTLVAAATSSCQATLITANLKDYPMDDIEVLEQP